MGKLILDTSAWINLERSSELHDRLGKTDQLMVPAPVLGELKVAANLVSRSTNARKATEAFIDYILANSEFLPIDSQTCHVFGQLKAHCMENGKTRGVNDLWIASATIRNQAELLTFDNRANFDGLPGLVLRN